MEEWCSSILFVQYSRLYTYYVTKFVTKSFMNCPLFIIIISIRIGSVVERCRESRVVQQMLCYMLLQCVKTRCQLVTVSWCLRFCLHHWFDTIAKARRISSGRRCWPDLLYKLVNSNVTQQQCRYTLNKLYNLSNRIYTI